MPFYIDADTIEAVGKLLPADPAALSRRGRNICVGEICDLMAGVIPHADLNCDATAVEPAVQSEDNTVPLKPHLVDEAVALFKNLESFRNVTETSPPGSLRAEKMMKRFSFRI